MWRESGPPQFPYTPFFESVGLHFVKTLHRSARAVGRVESIIVYKRQVREDNINTALGFEIVGVFVVYCLSYLFFGE